MVTCMSPLDLCSNVENLGSRLPLKVLGMEWESRSQIVVVLASGVPVDKRQFDHKCHQTRFTKRHHSKDEVCRSGRGRIGFTL